MNFKTVQEVFNHYRTASLEDIETRAVDIKALVATDQNADIDALNIELEGLKQAKANISEKQDGIQKRSNNFNPVTGMSFEANTTPKDDDIFESREYRSEFYKTMLILRLIGITCKHCVTSATSRRMGRAAPWLTGFVLMITGI